MLLTDLRCRSAIDVEVAKRSELGGDLAQAAALSRFRAGPMQPLGPLPRLPAAPRYGTSGPPPCRWSISGEIITTSVPSINSRSFLSWRRTIPAVAWLASRGPAWMTSRAQLTREIFTLIPEPHARRRQNTCDVAQRLRCQRLRLCTHRGVVRRQINAISSCERPET